MYTIMHACTYLRMCSLWNTFPCWQRKYNRARHILMVKPNHAILQCLRPSIKSIYQNNESNLPINPNIKSTQTSTIN